MTEQYYTPEPEDIRKGYMCQWLSKGYGEMEHMILDGHKEDIWVDTVLDIDNPWGHTVASAIKALKIGHENICTKKLCREDIESCGWQCTDDTKILTSVFYRMHDIGYVYEIRHNEETGNISIVNPGIGINQLYSGKCPSINELRWIMKMVMNVPLAGEQNK